MDLYPSTPHKAGLKLLKVLSKWESKAIFCSEKLINTVETVLKNKCFEFNGFVKQQEVSGAVIGRKCARTYIWIFMVELENEFLKTQERLPLVWFRYIDDIVFIWTHSSFETYLWVEWKRNFTFIFNGQVECKISTNLYINLMDWYQYLHFTSSHPNYTK